MAQRRRLDTTNKETQGGKEKSAKRSTANVSPVRLKESEFQQQVFDLAVWRGWRIVHFRPARVVKRGETVWRTPYTGHTGFPDLIIAKAGKVLICELKTETGKPSADQLAWLKEIGPVIGRLWRPSDWPEIEKTIT